MQLFSRMCRLLHYIYLKCQYKMYSPAIVCMVSTLMHTIVYCDITKVLATLYIYNQYIRWKYMYNVILKSRHIYIPSTRPIVHLICPTKYIYSNLVGTFTIARKLVFQEPVLNIYDINKLWNKLVIVFEFHLSFSATF